VDSEYVRSDYHVTTRYSTAGEPAIKRNQSQITLIMKGQALPVVKGNEWVEGGQSYRCMSDADIIETTDALSHSRAQALEP
jgi:hypothetical protein